MNASGDQSAEGLTTSMLDTVARFDVKPETCTQKLSGQSYDGASTMSDELNRVQKGIRDHFPDPHYTHYVEHRLTLCAKQSANRM